MRFLNAAYIHKDIMTRNTLFFLLKLVNLYVNEYNEILFQTLSIQGNRTSFDMRIPIEVDTSVSYFVKVLNSFYLLWTVTRSSFIEMRDEYLILTLEFFTPIIFLNCLNKPGREGVLLFFSITETKAEIMFW